MVRLFTDPEAPVRVWAVEPFMTRVALEPVMVPPVKSILPFTLQVLVPILIDSEPPPVPM